MSSAPQSPTLTGVSETALLTLRARAREAAHGEGIIEDPMAITLINSIDFDFAKFGPTRQDIALRALAFDTHTRRYLDRHPAATVVALAEGLQTSFWRLDRAIPDVQFHWLTVDLPPIIDLRARLLPESPRISVCAQSVLDYSWTERVDPSHGVFITAEGLLMYLQPEEALGLIAECARKFPGGQMLFDLPPVLLARLVRRGHPTSFRYRVPPMPFSMSVRQAANLVNTVPGVRAVHDLPLPPGRGLIFNRLLSTAYRIRALNALRPTLTLLEFG
ncbi:class I SAM-dependent methyltransferase [Mycobacterium shimoidei]|uniref:class I SAM-dependent methyltransferase n=1 Tax=Mycobacterium shimoidei TaxID=29313 RepID=UPI0008483C60|nr:class I SAM-dependent methyltransferase [Mycobacterium shimoidei]MCV7259776.1 class I SAM-dependent methyltransferase [Mycobacterium shimoidei]ODR12411.1 methyltransferase [Mycobacterium shimoidei]ORW81940.1 methyltransferase [Mycobacterium shimoidei]